MSTNKTWRKSIARWRATSAKQRRIRQRRNTLLLETLEPRRLLTVMNLDLLKTEAFELSQAAYAREVVTDIPILDARNDGNPTAIGLVFAEKDAIVTTEIRQDTFFIKPQVRASTNRQSMQVFTDQDRDGDFEELTYQDANPDFSSPVIQPPIDINDIPPEGRVLSQLTIGQDQSPGNSPQFLTTGAEAYGRFNGFSPQKVGSSIRYAASHLWFGRYC